MTKKWIWLAPLYLLSMTAYGVDTENILSGIVDVYAGAAKGWEDSIHIYATRLFFALLAIDLAWQGIDATIKQKDFTEILAELIRRFMVYGVFFTFLQFGSTWALAIVESLRNIASIAGGMETLHPSAILSLGIGIAGQMADAGGISNPADATLGAILALVTIILFALIAAELVLALVIMWVKVYAGVIMLGLGGSRWTQEYAVSYFKTALGAGVKLFVIQLLIGLGTTVLTSWAADLNAGNPKMTDFLAVAAGVIVLYALIKSVGEVVQSLMSGQASTSNMTDIAIAGAIAGSAAVQQSVAKTAGTVKGAAAGAVGGAAATAAAYQLATAGAGGVTGKPVNITSGLNDIKSGGEKPASTLGSKISSAAKTASGTAKNLAKAAGEDISARVQGKAGASSGTMGGRMAASMKDKAALARMESDVPGEDSITLGQNKKGSKPSNTKVSTNKKPK